MKQAVPAAVLSRAAVQELVDARLASFLDLKIIHAGAISAEYKELLTVTREHVLAGGKRLRPYLAYLGYTLAGGTAPESITALYAALELLHAFLLVHDDIIDRDLFRHNRDNITGRYLGRFKRLRPASEARHYADAMALLAGDFLAASSFEMLEELPTPPEQKTLLRQEFFGALFTVIGGEQVDTLSPFQRELSLAELITICRTKTASYSTELPLRAGALCAGAAETVRDQLTEFGQSLGVAYQLTDDLLTSFGTEKEAGKKLFNDFREGKYTALIFFARQAATAKERGFIQKVLGSTAASPADFRLLLTILERTGARMKTERLSEQYRDRAIAALRGFDHPAAQALRRIAEFAVQRSS